MAIHPSAIIEPGAQIDPTVDIGPYVIIGPDVVIGARTTVSAHAVIEYTHMGVDNKILPGAYLGGPPQDLKYAGEKTLLIMGDRNTVREAVTLNRGTAACGQTRIGSGCLFMANSHVAHDCVIGNNVILVNSVACAGHVDVGDYTIVGGLSGIHQYVRIGRYCMIGAGSMVGKDMPSFCLCQGDRATLRGLNLLGMRRAGLGREIVSAIKTAYKTLFLSGQPLEAALAQLKAGNPIAEVREMVDFIERSKRGTLRPAAANAPQDEEVTV